MRPKKTRMSKLIILNKKLKKETIEYRNQIKKFIHEKEEYINEKKPSAKKRMFGERIKRSEEKQQ